jgi:hypothetical protein
MLYQVVHLITGELQTICVCAIAVNSEFVCVQFLRGIQNDRQICEIELLWLFSIVQYSR